MKKFFSILGLPFKKLFNKIKNLSVKGKVILVSVIVVLAGLAVGGYLFYNSYQNKPMVVSFDSQFGTAVSSVTLKRGEVYSISTAPAPERTAMEFTGWYLDKNGKTPYVDMPIKKNITLYAGWVATGLSVSKDLGQIPANSFFTIFSTEKIAPSQLSEYIQLTSLIGAENTITATEQTNKSSTGYYYKVTAAKSFDADGIYSLKVLKPTKAWVTDVNGKSVSDKVSTDYSFTITHPVEEAESFDKVEKLMCTYSNSAIAAIVNSVLDSYRMAVNAYTGENDISAMQIDKSVCAASFEIGPNEYVDANKPASTLKRTGFMLKDTVEIVDGRAVVGLALTDGTLYLSPDGNANGPRIDIKVAASETYSLSDTCESKNDAFRSMDSDFYRTVFTVNSKLTLEVTATIPSENNGTQQLKLVNASKSLGAYYDEIEQYTKHDSDSETEEDSTATSDTDIELANVLGFFVVASHPGQTIDVKFILSLDRNSTLLSDSVVDCTTEYFATNGLRTFDESGTLSEITTFARPVYGKRIISQVAKTGSTSSLFSCSSADFGANYVEIDGFMGISKDSELISKVTLTERSSKDRLNISNSKHPLSKRDAASETSTSADYLKSGNVSIHLFSRLLDLTDPDSGNGTRYMLIGNKADSADSGESAENVALGVLANPADVHIYLKNIDIPYYTIGAGDFEKPEKEAASLISISNGRININPACNKADFDLIIRPKDSRIKDDSEDYSDARIIHVSFETLKEYKPCKATIYDTEGVELFTGNFNIGDTISVDFSSPSNKAQFLIFAQYNTNSYQPSTLAFYNAPMGTEGQKLSGLIPLTGDLKIYLTLKTSFNEIEWYCRYGSEVDKAIKEKTKFTYNGTATEINHPDIPETTIIEGEYENTEVKLISFSDNYTIIDGKYKRYTNVGYINLNRTKISYQAHIYVKYPNVEEPVEYAILPGKYGTDFVFPEEFLTTLSKTCEIIGFCKGDTIPEDVTPLNYETWAADKDIFAAPEHNVSEVSYCALVRYNPGTIETILTNLKGEIVQSKTIFSSSHITPEKLSDELNKLPQAEFTPFWNDEKSVYEVYHFSGFSEPVTILENDGFAKTTSITGVYTYAGQTDFAAIDFKSGCDLKIYSRDLNENPNSKVLREQPDDYTFHILGSTGYIDGTEIRPSSVSFVAPELDIPEQYKDILTYKWVADNNPALILSPDTMYSMGIVPAEGLTLHPVFDDVRVVELTVTDGTISETTFVFGTKGNRMTEDAVITAAMAVNPALSELSSEIAFPLYYFGSRDSFDSPVLIDQLIIAFKHKFKQVRLHTGDGGPFEDNTVLQIIEGEPDTPIKESAAKRVKELSTTASDLSYIRGYTFLGFAETPDGEPMPLSTYTYSNQDLYAIYSRYTKWAVKFVTNEGSFKDKSVEKMLYVLDGSFPELPDSPSVTGKAFTGWTDVAGKRLEPEKIEIHSATTYYASFDHNTFKVELRIGSLSCTYDGKVHTPEIKVSGLPSGYTCTVSTDFSSKDVTNGKKSVGYKDLVVLDKNGMDITSRARVTAVYGSLEIKPATLKIVTDSIEITYVNEFSTIVGTGSCSGTVGDEYVDFKVTGFINFYNTDNPALAEWQRTFFTEHNFVESSNTWQIDWSRSTAKQSNYTIVETLGTLRMAKRSIATFKCNSAFLLKTGNVSEARVVLAVAAAHGNLHDTFICTYELDAGSKLTSFDFPYIWTYAPYFENDDISFSTKDLKQITSSDIRSITVQRTSDGTILGEYGLDSIWQFELDQSYTFQINLK